MAVPEACKSCMYRFNDASEGQLCRKVNRKIVLDVEKCLVMEWPGFAVNEAFKECAGALAQPSFLARVRYTLSM